MVTVTNELLPDAASFRPGRVIVLNGASSSGKSSIAIALLDRLEGAWYHLGVDTFHRARNKRTWTDAEFLPLFQRTVLGFHRAIAGMASAGNDVLIDHVLGEDWRLADLLVVLDGFPVLFVGVHCSLPELERRERVRGNRTIGRAAVQYPLVHQHQVYDLEVDSEARTPEECAGSIHERLQTEEPWTAFARLRASADCDLTGPK